MLLSFITVLLVVKSLFSFNNISYLLNIIDGIRETPGRILIITSNNYDSLDDALIRPGRIDYSLRMNNASNITLSKMVRTR